MTLSTLSHSCQKLVFLLELYVLKAKPLGFKANTVPSKEKNEGICNMVIILLPGSL